MRIQSSGQDFSVGDRFEFHIAAGIYFKTPQGGLGDGTAELISNLIDVNALTEDETRDRGNNRVL